MCSGELAGNMTKDLKINVVTMCYNGDDNDNLWLQW